MKIHWPGKQNTLTEEHCWLMDHFLILKSCFEITLKARECEILVNKRDSRKKNMLLGIKYQYRIENAHSLLKIV